MITIPTHPFTRTRARAAAYACAAVATACAMAGGAGAASTTAVVTADIPSATTLITTGCAPGLAGITDFGVVQPGTTAKTGTDCTVTFGSSNDSASLRLAQSDGAGTAMAHPTDVWTRHTGGSSRMARVSSGFGQAIALRTNGDIRRSTDNGVTWSSAYASGLNQNSNISVGSLNTAWGTTGTTTVLRSTNLDTGAPTWPATATAPGMASTYAIAAASASEAWVVGSGGAISRTTDGGSTWTAHASTTANSLRGAFRLDANSVIAWGDSGTVVETTDGATWRTISNGTLPSTLYDGVALTDDIVIVTSSSSIWRTTNATAATPTWTQIDSGTHLPIRAIAFENATNGYVAGSNGVLLRTTDAGATWTESDVDAAFSVSAMTVPTAGSVIAVGSGNSILESSNSGSSWTSRLAGTTQAWLDVAASTDGFVWRAGGDGEVSRSSDGGTTWAASVTASAADLFSVHAFDTQRLVAVGRDGTIVTSSNGGTSWTARTSGTSVPLYGVTGANYGIAWAVGEDGLVLRSSDYGATWQQLASTPGKALVSVVATDETHAVAFGDDGAASRTSNGTTWSTFTLPGFPKTVGGASAVLAGTNTIGVYDGNDFYRSDDSGATWTDVGDLPNSGMNGLTWVTSTRLYGAANGILYTSNDAGATWSSVAAGAILGHWMSSAVTIDRSRVVVVGDGNMAGSTGTSDPVADYQNGVSDWNDGSEAFGACLRATDATATWTVNGTCDQSADGPHWRGIPTGTGSGSEVANAASIAGTKSASLRFGLRVDPTQPPGELSAGLTFVVVAPAA